MFHIERPTHMILCNDIEQYLRACPKSGVLHVTEQWQIAVDTDYRIVARRVKDDGVAKHDLFMYASSLYADDWKELQSSSPQPISSQAWEDMLKGEQLQVYSISFERFTWRDENDQSHDIVMFGNSEYGVHLTNDRASQLDVPFDESAEYYFHSVNIPDHSVDALNQQLSVSVLARYHHQSSETLNHHLRCMFARLALQELNHEITY